MNKSYNIASIIIAVTSVIISLILFINEHISFKITGTVIFTLVAFIISIICRPTSKLIIHFGNKLGSKIEKVIYYSLIPIAATLLSIAAYMIITSLDIEMSLGLAIVLVLISCCIFIMLIVPYIQAVLVLMIDKIYIKNNNNTQD